MSVWTNKFIKPNKYSRPQIKLTKARKIILHWTANYGATALNHYNYFNNLTGRYASAHLFVDKKEALCIVPLDEVTYQANDGTYRGVPELKPNANFLSIGVEVCVEKDGTFHPDTLSRTVDVVAELCKMYNLDPIQDIVRHYDVTHKNCPAPWVKNEQEFISFKDRVKDKLTPKKEIINQYKPQQEKLEEELSMKMVDLIGEYKMDRLATIYREAKQDGILDSNEWESKAKDRSLTLGECVYLNSILDHRRFRDYCKKKCCENCICKG